MVNKIKAWVNAARLRTLPLSISGIIVGTALAHISGYFNVTIFILALFTTIGFQVCSNFANDYGDGVKGTDNDQRIGPKRALQSGLLSAKELKNGIIISIVINIFLVIALIYTSFGLDHLLLALLFLALGIISIWAAIKYTVGDSAYGYRGLGDIFVFVFFGLLGVCGTAFLYHHNFSFINLLPAISIGALSTAVLNLNNLRDHKSDAQSNKNTLVVKIGFKNGKIYHTILIISSFLSFLCFSVFSESGILQFVYLVAFTPIFLHLKRVWHCKDAAFLDPELKILALSTFALSLLFYLVYYYFCIFVY